MIDRLTKSAWLDQGLRTLANEGYGALKVGPMAASLEVSRGSFYWHFRDIADFRSQLLGSWRDRMTDQVIREMEADTAEPDRLRHLLARAFAEQPRLDRSIRSWAATDDAVAAIVAAVDARRVAYIARLIATTGVKEGPALARAKFLYWAYLGQAMVMDPRHASIAPAAIEDIAELMER